MPKYICDKCSREYMGNFCPNCGDKRTKKDEEEMTDAEIIVDMLEDTKESLSKKIKSISKRRIMGIVLLLIAALLFFLAMYQKNAYYNDGNKKVNAYVEEDVYNYLINSNYFIGYMSLTGAFVISGILVIILEPKKRN